MHDPHSFMLLVLGALLVYGLATNFVAALVIIVLLSIIAAAPQLGAVIAIGAAVAVLLRVPIKWFLEGYFGGLGLSASGLFRPRRVGRRRARLIRSARAALVEDSREPPQPRYRRGDRYQPWPDEGDDWPSNLGGPEQK